MQHHPIILLVQKIEPHYSKEIQKYLAVSKRQRTEKLYKLIIGAKNEEQLERGLLFKKLFGKTYSEKNDYLWRNEIRLLKEELEIFLIQKEHEYFSKSNQAYNDWLLMHAYDKLKFTEGMDEKHETLLKEKDGYASYAFVLDACLLQLNNLHYKISDLSKRLNLYPEHIRESKKVLTDLVSAYCAKLNVYCMHYNWISYNHQSEQREPLILDEYNFILEKNPINNFYNHYASSFSISSEPDFFETQIQHLNEAIEIIEPLYKQNKLLLESRFLVLMSKGRELSANGYFLEAHETLSQIKVDVDKLNIHHKTTFYVNYITNLVKCQFYKEALYTLEHEFSTDNLLYKNMLLQNRLLCYLYLRDTNQLKKYISYDLDAAPFPQNYVLKLIKSVYFYLVQEYDTALSVVTSLIQAKMSSEKMQYHKSISILYKKLYVAVQKNALQKKLPAKDIKMLRDAIEEFERITPPEFKLVSVYLWLKHEFEHNLS